MTDIRKSANCRIATIAVCVANTAVGDHLISHDSGPRSFAAIGSYALSPLAIGVRHRDLVYAPQRPSDIRAAPSTPPGPLATRGDLMAPPDKSSREYASATNRHTETSAAKTVARPASSALSSSVTATSI